MHFDISERYQSLYKLCIAVGLAILTMALLIFVYAGGDEDYADRVSNNHLEFGRQLLTIEHDSDMAENAEVIEHLYPLTDYRMEVVCNNAPTVSEVDKDVHYRASATFEISGDAYDKAATIHFAKKVIALWRLEGESMRVVKVGIEDGGRLNCASLRS